MNGWRRTYKEVDLAFVIVGEINKRKSWAGVLRENRFNYFVRTIFFKLKVIRGVMKSQLSANLLELKKDQVISTLLGNAVRLLS